MQLDAGTRAVVTGAGKGIGRALAQRLGPRAVALPCDVGSAEEVAAAVERFVAEAGGLDLAIATRASRTTGASRTRTRSCTSG